MTSMNFDDALRQRYSVRAYDPERPVAPEAIEAILEAARIAPSACNSQTWRFVVVRDRPTLDRLCDEAMMPVVRNAFLRQAPVVIVGGSKLDLVANRLGSGVTGIEYYLIDLGIAMEHMALKAASMGLGTCWIGWFREKKVKELLGIPRGVRVTSLLALGYPKNPDPPAKRPRKPLDEIAFDGHWSRPWKPGREA